VLARKHAVDGVQSHANEKNSGKKKQGARIAETKNDGTGCKGERHGNEGNLIRSDPA
jgi:hypothetical protein